MLHPHSNTAPMECRASLCSTDQPSIEGSADVMPLFQQGKVTWEKGVLKHAAGMSSLCSVFHEARLPIIIESQFVHLANLVALIRPQASSRENSSLIYGPLLVSIFSLLHPSSLSFFSSSSPPPPSLPSRLQNSNLTCITHTHILFGLVFIHHPSIQRCSRNHFEPNRPNVVSG